MICSMSQRTSATSAASASWEIIAATKKPKIMEVGLSQNAATAGVYGLGRPAAIGISPTTPQTWLDEQDGNDGTCNTKSALAWGTGPTVPANFFRRLSCTNQVGVGVIWSFPRGIGLPTSSILSLVIWIIATAPVCDVWGVADE